LNLKSRRDYANNNSNNSDNRPRKQHKMSCLILHMWILKKMNMCSREPVTDICHFHMNTNSAELWCIVIGLT